MIKGRVAEVFLSIQGEGICTGIKQLFVRFFGCNLSCRFCDTKLSIYREYSVQELLDEILSFENDYHSISITGGEPLLQKDFLNEFLPILKTKGKRIYLETNGTLPDALGQIIDSIDIIAMDFKLPSSTGLNSFWQAHRIFLKMALAKDVFVKAVIASSTVHDDIRKTRDIIAEVNSNIILVLQPVTPVDDVRKPDMDKLVDFQKICLEKIKTVKIIPQFHKMIKVR